MRLSSGLDFRLINVSIHASVKDATFTVAAGLNTSRFNPRICKRCDKADAAQPTTLPTVSIHASVKDATANFPYQ